jgi:methionyl-tRNA formyltransferase
MKPTLIYFGTPDFSATVLEKIIQSGEYTVKAVVTNPDAPVGRQQIMTPSPVSQVAQSHHISTLKPVKIDPEFLREHSDTLQADLYIVFAFGQILPKELIEKPPHGTLNIHTSLLPKYRGTAPVQAAIYNQESQTGPTIMVMDEQMDHGPILAQEPFILDPKDTTETVTQKMAEAGAALLLKALPDYLENTIIPQAQDDTQATFTWKKAEMKEAGYFDIENPPTPEKLDAMIRAFYPWPNAWTKWNGKIVKFYPGGLVQMEGKNKVKLEEFLRGYPDFPIKYL